MSRAFASRARRATVHRARLLGCLLGSAVVATPLLVGSALALTPAAPIEDTGPAPTLPAYIGAPATPDPVAGVKPAWQDPFMAPYPRNSVHNDAWASDNYATFSGPLGRDLRTFSTAIGRDCITLTFDPQGQLIGTCSDLKHGPALYLIDPRTLATLAFKQLPYVPPPAGTNPALNTTGGAYFYLDNHGRVVLAAGTGHILVFALDQGRGAPHFQKVADYDPTPCLSPGDRIPSVLPDAQGRLWFVGRYHGAVGVLDPKTGRCRSVILHQQIENSFAVATDGVYIVTDKAMYKFRAGANLIPEQIWSRRYRNIGIQKVGQINAGSGTTPTLIASNPDDPGSVPAYVAIGDNANPMDVVVYRAEDRLGHGQHRVVCTVPVFHRNASADENSLISMGRSLIVENNYGYDLQKWNDVIAGGIKIGGNLGLVSAPGMDRIDIAADGSGCRVVWRNTTIRTPSAVAKGDTANGLIYTYVKPKDGKAGVWYWAALSYRTGKVVWERVAGHGGLYNNHYSGIAIGRDPRTGKTTLYLGGVGGIMALRDG
jgi:streptogramin lyase